MKETFDRAARLREHFKDKSYRDSYVAAHTRQFLAAQVRALRGERSQEEFAQILGKKQTSIHRLENPAYGPRSIGALMEIAAKLDIAVFVRFVDHETFIAYTSDQDDDAKAPKPFVADKDA